MFTSRTFSHGALYGDMRAAWSLAKEVKFRPIHNNLFSVQFSCLADWERVMQGGPWLIRRCPVLMAEYDGWGDVDAVELVKFPAWVQVLDLKEKIQTGNIAKQLSRRAGEFVALDEHSVMGAGGGVRVRVFTVGGRSGRRGRGRAGVAGELAGAAGEGGRGGLGGDEVGARTRPAGGWRDGEAGGEAQARGGLPRPEAGGGAARRGRRRGRGREIFRWGLGREK